MRGSRKSVRCKFCAEDVLSKNFVRHIENNHRDENEVKKCLIFPKGSKQRRNALILLRKGTNFDLYLDGVLRPYRQTEVNESTIFYPCIYCKGLFKKTYLKRHSKVCTDQKTVTDNNQSYRRFISDSQTFAACALDPTNVISKLDVKEQVFDIMKGDNISFEAKKDLLIAHFGESYLKKHKRERKEYACSSRMRELSSGKGSRAIIILVPKLLQTFINTLLKYRNKYISSENEYVFAMPQSRIQWGQGDVAIRFLAKRITLQHPEAISSNKLRKQIATVAQIMSLTKEDTKQFSKFMGHTEKTHSEFYELPADIYQTAKVSKLLLLMEKGSLPIEYKGKCLDDIDLGVHMEYAEENNECRTLIQVIKNS
nr:unnamed protein product [Callosobruchus chinensis]